MNPKRILLVEDNEIDCKAVDRALKKCYSSAQLAVRNDGPTALELLEGEGFVPDLVILDIKLPKMSGPDILKWLRGWQKTARTPIVMLTSSDEASDIATCYQLGANSYIRKPEDYDTFGKRVCDVAKYWLDLNVA